jgi:spermidine/putrescine transport system permease protein
MSKPLIWFGQLTTRPRLTRRGLSLALAPTLWLTLLLLIPLCLLTALAFAKRGTYGAIDWSFTLENFKRLLGYGILGYSNNNLIILARSLWIAFVTTTLSLLLAYPLAFFIASRSPRTRYTFLALVMIPFCTNMVIRAYAWMLLLSKDLPLAKLAAFFHLIPADTPLYPSAFAIYLGMLSCFLPFAVLPLYTNIERLDWSLLEAAQDLYASRYRVFRHAILPQTLPGLWAAIILTFIPAMGTFVIPDLLGGANHWLVGNLIQQQFGKSRDLPFGAAASFALMLLTLLALFAFRRSPSSEGASHEN